MTQTKTKKDQIPNFKTREDAAEFFDTHDMEEFQDEFITAKASFSQNVSQGITIRLDHKALAKLQTQANKRGIGPTKLVRT